VNNSQHFNQFITDDSIHDSILSLKQFSDSVIIKFGYFPADLRVVIREIAFTTFDKNDVTPLGLSYLINTSIAIIFSSLRDLKASMAEIIIE
jgi:hypothetical protein